MNATPSEMVSDVVRAGLRSAPPVTVWALTLNEWLAVASIFYVVLQSAYLVAKWRRERRGRAK